MSTFTNIEIDIRLIKIQSCFYNKSIHEALLQFLFCIRFKSHQGSHYIELPSFKNWPILNNSSGTLRIRYSFHNFTCYVNYFEEKHENICLCNFRKSLMNPCSIPLLTLIGSNYSLYLLYQSLSLYFQQIL